MRHTAGRRARRLAQVGATIAISVVALLGAVPPASASVVGGIWPLSEGSGQVVHDISGNHNDGTLGSTPVADANDPTWIPGVLPWSHALHFNGTQFVTIPDAPSLDSATITLAAIVRAGSSPGAFRYIAAKGAFRCEVASYGLYTGASGGLSFYVSNGVNSYMVSPDAGTGVWDGRWHLVVGTFDGTTVRLFVDGHQVGTGSPSTIVVHYGLPDGNQLAIGDYLGSCPTTLGFVGDIGGLAVLQDVVPSLSVP